MVTRLGVILGFLSHYKYFITIVVGVLIVGVIDENSFRKRIQYELQISDLNDEIDKYNSIYVNDSKQLRDLRYDPKAIERIARERYFMKADDEDIYVLSSDEPTENSDNEDDETNE
nr:septum formation initiator family protein [Prevotella sp.]